ncbi:hypothetical protein [Brucella sp. 6810]|uniref:hypothetical protein n=1 Tax=Brucella sp. 6810 TaxID=2769351 RepID=UPI003530474E
MRLDWWNISGKLEAKACLRKADGPVIVEGPFAANPTYLDALTNLTGRDVEAVTGSTGTSLGAGLLAGATGLKKHGKIFKPSNTAYAAYQTKWLNMINH